MKNLTLMILLSLTFTAGAQKAVQRDTQPGASMQRWPMRGVLVPLEHDF